jgi:hypothetical protein
MKPGRAAIRGCIAFATSAASGFGPEVIASSTSWNLNCAASPRSRVTASVELGSDAL